MFISAGEPGNAKKIQASVAAARKVFRILGVCLQNFAAVSHPRALADCPYAGVQGSTVGNYAHRNHAQECQ